MTDDQNEANIHSFIVKIWVERNLGKGEEPTWRGHITHIPGNERQYVKNLEEITHYFEQRLRFLGIEKKSKE